MEFRFSGKLESPVRKAPCRPDDSIGLTAPDDSPPLLVAERKPFSVDKELVAREWVGLIVDAVLDLIDAKPVESLGELKSAFLRGTKP